MRCNGHTIKKKLVFHSNGSRYETKEETLKMKTEINMGITEWKMSHSKKTMYGKITTMRRLR
jgi:hypothetical protein